MARLGDDDADAHSDEEIVDSGDEQDHVMDPSDPRAHGRKQLLARASNGGDRAVQSTPVSRWDSDREDGEEDEEEVDEDLGVPVQMDEEDEDEPVKEKASEEDSAATRAVNEKLKARLSSWAAARFLVPRSERPVPVLEEPPIEPLNDFILSDFGTRFRGRSGDVAVEKAVDDGDASDEDGEPADKFTVGAPLYESDEKKKKAEPAQKDKAGGDAGKKRRPESRYFITDLATKCFNCGQVGHVSAVCANDRVQKPCYYCALRGHSSFACPHLPCSACFQLGHEPRDCPAAKKKTKPSCALCGRVGHGKESCDVRASLATATCMVCAEPGHLHCAPIPPPADRRVYCAYCAGNHALARCRDYVAPAPVSFTARLPRADMKCFLCNTAGHIAAECPKRSGYNGGNSCFNCGERGHYASDCPRPRGGGNSTNSSSRKRGRNEYYADDYEDEDAGARRRGNGKGGSNNRHTRYVETYAGADDDEGDDQYYYVPSASKKPRLDAALPSYRQSNGGYKRHHHNGNGDSRRGRW